MLPKAIYLAKILSGPKKIIEETKRAILRFIWSGKMLRVKGEVCFKTQKEGGLGLINIELFFRVLFIKGVWSIIKGDGKEYNGILAGLQVEGDGGDLPTSSRTEIATRMPEISWRFHRGHQNVERKGLHRQIHYGGEPQKDL